MALHPELNVLAAGTADCTVHLLDSETLAPLANTDSLCSDHEEGASMDIGSLSFLPSGEFLLASNANGLVLLNTLAALFEN